ncbi:MAG: hypothetical protein JWN45_371 [Acidobacteriaceae bacterium]|nr:hypothetical protein [Acidobacteriaceae bacterium]
MSSRIILIILGLTTVVSTMSGQKTLLGVLEDVPGNYAGEGDRRGVRVLFSKEGNDWQSFPSNCPDQNCLETISSQYPRQVTWTISFDGRSLGHVTGRTPADFKKYSHVGLQEITAPDLIPTIGRRSTEYSGYEDTPLYRPLVANSHGFFKDPESWKPSQLSVDIVSRLYQQFRRKFPKLCSAVEDESTHESKLEPLSYRKEDLKVVKSYSSREGWTIARLHLAGAIDCEDVEAGFEIDDPWFTADPKNSVQYLAQGMWLVDAGDYDNDGKSELLFSIDRDNRGGYEFFYDHFKKRAKFEFSFH